MMPRPVLVRCDPPQPDIEEFLFTPMPLVRQTNRHELLSQECRDRWWNATSQAEREGILDEELCEPDELDDLPPVEPPHPLVRQTNLHEL